MFHVEQKTGEQMFHVEHTWRACPGQRTDVKERPLAHGRRHRWRGLLFHVEHERGFAQRRKVCREVGASRCVSRGTSDAESVALHQPPVGSCSKWNTGRITSRSTWNNPSGMPAGGRRCGRHRGEAEHLEESMRLRVGTRGASDPTATVHKTHPPCEKPHRPPQRTPGAQRASRPFRAGRNGGEECLRNHR